MTRGFMFFVAIVLVVAYGACFNIALQAPTFDAAGSLALAPMVLVAWFLIARLLAYRQPPRLSRLLLLSVPVHAAASIVRLVVEELVYGGIADAGLYLTNGSEVASQIWGGGAGAIEFRVGTRAMEVVTGYVLAVVGPTTITGFFAFSALSWFGLYLFLRSFQISFPKGDDHLYLVLLMFLPSLLFWPSVVGKDPWLILCLGLATYGIVHVWAGGRLLIAPTALGLIGAVLVRPHMALLLIVATGIALMLGRRTVDFGVGRLFAIAAVAVGGAVIASQAQSFLGLESFSISEVSSVADRIGTQTSRGGSQFGNVATTNIFLLPLSLVSVILRPFPWEAQNVLALFVSLESVGLVAILVRGRRHIRALARTVAQSPFLLLCIVFVLEFVVGFSNFNNLGLLARERSQMLPFLLVLFAAARPAPVVSPAKVDKATASSPNQPSVVAWSA